MWITGTVFMAASLVTMETTAGHRAVLAAFRFLFQRPASLLTNVIKKQEYVRKDVGLDFVALNVTWLVVVIAKQRMTTITEKTRSDAIVRRVNAWTAVSQVGTEVTVSV